MAKGEKPLTNVQWREFAEQKAHRGRLWNMIGKEQFVRGMWEDFRRERDRVNVFREQAKEEKKAGNARPVAAGIASQRILGVSEMLP